MEAGECRLPIIMQNLKTGLYLGRKLLNLIPVLIGLSIISFLLGVIAPGDPAYFILSADGFTEPTDEEIHIMQAQLGLDKPIHIQYLRWLNRAARGDLGRSYMTGKAVSSEIIRRLPVTLKVSLLAVAFTIFIGISSGILMAAKSDKVYDRIGQIISLCLISIPGFWLAIFLISLFAERLRFLPTCGYDSFKSILLPAFVLAAGTMGFTMRLTRASLLDELHKDYIITAHSKGLKYNVIVLKHAFRNSLIPVITLIGTYFGHILGGSVIVEVIFALPGIGQFVVDGIFARDYPVIQGYVLFTGTVFVLVNLAIDSLYLLFNPKVRFEETP